MIFLHSGCQASSKFLDSYMLQQNDKTGNSANRTELYNKWVIIPPVMAIIQVIN